MDLEARLAQQLVTSQPARAAAVLERLGVDAGTAYLGAVDIAVLARIAPLLSAQFAADVLQALPPPTVAALLERLSLDVAARLARTLEDATEPALARLGDDTARAIRALLAFQPDAAGGLMDPRVLALPGDLTVGEALERIRRTPERARYNLYVVDREQHLAGVLNLRELLLADPEERLSARMVPNPRRIPAEAGREAIVAHPGWREAHALPVVDGEGRYLGAIRYRVLRELEAGLADAPGDETAGALGELLAVGAGGVLRALTSGGEEF